MYKLNICTRCWLIPVTVKEPLYVCNKHLKLKIVINKILKIITLYIHARTNLIYFIFSISKQFEKQKISSLIRYSFNLIYSSRDPEWRSGKYIE